MIFKDWLDNHISLTPEQGELIQQPQVLELLEQTWQAAQRQFKPSWDDAPEWAEYLAQDMDGEWRWFKTKPRLRTELHYWIRNSAEHKSASSPRDWTDTLEKRPGGVEC